MMGFLERYWSQVAIALVAGALILSLGAENRGMDAELRDARANVAAANARTVDAERAVARMDAVIDSLRPIAAARQETARVAITRWRTRVDTLTVTQVVALADSTITACERGLVSCEETVAALDAAVAARDTALVRGSEERDALRTYARDLEERLEGGDPIWPTLVSVAGGGLLGYAADGPSGAFVGAGVGLGFDIGRRGVMSLIRSVP